MKQARRKALIGLLALALGAAIMPAQAQRDGALSPEEKKLRRDALRKRNPPEVPSTLAPPNDAEIRRQEILNRREEAREQRREEIRDQREQRRERLRERLDQADENSDRAISRDEAKRSMPRLHQDFDRIDSNGDGTITPDEIRAFWRERARQRRAEPGGPDPRL